MNTLAANGAGSRVDQAVHFIREFIRERDMKVGDTLPSEAHFASELGVSRAVTREAFGALAALRVIDVANGRKARVGAIDGTAIATSLQHALSTAQVSLAQVWDVRRTLEFRTVELAAQNRSPDDAREILAEASAMACAPDRESLSRHDIRLHQLIARASGNLLFYHIVRSFEPLMERAVPTAWDTRTTLQERDTMIACHRQLAEAIAAGKADAAQDALASHFASSITALLSETEHRS